MEEEHIEVYKYLKEDVKGSGCASYSPYIAHILILGECIEKGLKPHIKGVTHLSYNRDGEISSLIFAKTKIAGLPTEKDFKIVS
jgi:hypothetical protein